MKQHLFVTLTFILLLLSPSSYAQSPTYGDCQIFPSDSIFNTKITNAPVHQNSDRWLKSVGKGVRVHPDFGDGRYRGKDIGIPVNYTNTETPRYPVKFRYDRESDHILYPIPDFVKIEGGAYGDGDRHILSFDTDECKLYELFHVFRRESGDWIAGSGAVFDLSKNKLRKLGWTSADAAGLPIYPFLVKYEEVKSGRIDHALRFTLNVTNRKYIWPATHFASRQNNNNLPPMGMRLRLKPNVDTSHFSAPAQIIATALKEYGMILADNGGDLYISGEPSDQWDNNQLRDLKKLTTEDFEVVDTSYLMISPDSAATDVNSYESEKLLEQIVVEKREKRPTNKAKYIKQFYVSPKGNDTNSGSYSSPWRSIQHAANLSSPGDTINIESGDYRAFTIHKSGTVDAPITFYADRALVDGFIGGAKNGISVRGADHIKIKGFEVKYAKVIGIKADDCEGLTLEWNIISDNKSSGIAINNCDDVVIQHNRVSSSRDSGIAISGKYESLKIHNNSISEIDANALIIRGGTNSASNFNDYVKEISNNTFFNNGSAGGASMSLNGVDQMQVFNNLLYNNKGTGIALFQGNTDKGSRSNLIVHNTIVMPVDGRWCFQVRDRSIDNSFMNNLCLSKHKYRGSINIAPDSLAGFKSDYNGLSPRFTTDASQSTMDFDDWKSWSGQDNNSVVIDSVDSVFNSYTISFIPLGSSPVISSGLSIPSVSIDKNGKQRKSTPTIGAIEVK